MSRIPSLKGEWKGGKCGKPSILVLEVSHKNRNPVHLLIERTETYKEYEGQVVEASIELTYQIINQDLSFREVEGGAFSASYCRNHIGRGECVRLTYGSMGSSGFVVVDPEWLQGNHLGSYLMNEIVTWAQQWPSAEVMTICTLLSGKPSPSNTDTGRRNPFYERFGIEFDRGVSRPMKVGNLNSVNHWEKNIKEIPLERLLAETLGQRNDLQLELQARDHSLKEIRKDWEFAVTKPVRWALQQLFR